MKLLFQCQLLAAPLLTIISTSYVATAQIARPASVKSSSWIRVQATTDKDRYAAGEPIKVALKATNIVSRDAYLKYPSGQRFELKLFRDGILRANIDQPVYTWSANKNFVMSVSHIRFKPGQSELYQGEIGSEMGDLAPGLYRLEAQLTNSSGIGAAPVFFNVAPRVASANAPTTAPNATLGATPNATLGATTDKRVYKVGERVKVNCLLQNNPATATTFTFGSGQTYDVFIRNPAGELVWDWAANKRFLMVSRPVTLAAGAQQKFSVEWDGRALPTHEITPGEYTVEAQWASAPTVKAAPVAIEIR